jgi:putative effector of murein hydrolase LrgA (UPF0299 family)
MKNLSEGLKNIFGLGFLVAVLGLVIANLYFKAYATFFVAFALLMVSGGWLYAGIKRIQTANAQGEHIPWWKHDFILNGLAFGLSGAAVLIDWLIPNGVNDMLKNSVNALLVVVSLSLFIYLSISGVFHRFRANKRPEQPLEGE